MRPCHPGCGQRVSKTYVTFLDVVAPDVLVTDLSMPVVSGLEALKLYQFTTSTPIPILILSANVTSEVIAECQRAGAAEFIPKPMRASVLLEAIENHLATRAEDGASGERGVRVRGQHGDRLFPCA